MAATQLPASQHPITVNSGAKMHQLGFGTWQAKKGEGAAAVEVALKAGFRHIDGAMIYRNEGEVGDAIAKCIAEGVVKREDVFVTTKLWNIHHSPSDVEKACRGSLKRLGLDTLDLYIMHYPTSWANRQTDIDDITDATMMPKNEQGGSHQNPVPILDTYKAMEALVDAKLVDSLGISNVSLEEAKEVLAGCRIKPAAIQVECHPCLPQTELKALCVEHGIVLQAYCPLGIGMQDASKSLLQHPFFVDVAKDAGMTAAELLLRWNLTKGNVTLSKSITPERIAQNAATPAEPLSAALVATLDEFGAKHPLRVWNPTWFFETGPTPLFPDGRPGSF